MNRPVSLCVPSWNEGAALQRLLLSSLHASDLVREWVVLDHRSTDDTQARLDDVEPALAACGVRLRRAFEARDFCGAFTMSDLRNAALAACEAPIAGMMDADFVFGVRFRETLAAAVDRITRDRVAVVRFPIPVAWDELRTDAGGRITKHGRVWVHSPSNRIMLRAAVEYRQTGGNGKWERLHFTTSRRRWDRVQNDGGVLTSINIKPPERLALRETMTFFLEDAVTGARSGLWLEEYERGGLRKMPKYDFNPTADLTRVRLNLANLVLP